MKLSAVQLPCGKCGNPVTVELQAVPTMINTEGMSCVIWEHPRATKCLTCDSMVVPVVMQIQSIKLVAAPVQEESRIITASAFQ